MSYRNHSPEECELPGCAVTGVSVFIQIPSTPKSSPGMACRVEPSRTGTSKQQPACRAQGLRFKETSSLLLLLWLIGDPFAEAGAMQHREQGIPEFIEGIIQG